MSWPSWGYQGIDLWVHHSAHVCWLLFSHMWALRSTCVSFSSHRLWLKKKKAYSTQVRGCWTWNQCLKTFAISGHSVSTMFSKSHPMIQMTIPGSCFNYSWFFFFSFLSHARFSLKLYIKTLPPFTQGHPIIKFYLGFWRELEHLSKKKRFGGFGFLLLQPI